MPLRPRAPAQRPRLQEAVQSVTEDTQQGTSTMGLRAKHKALRNMHMTQESIRVNTEELTSRLTLRGRTFSAPREKQSRIVYTKDQQLNMLKKIKLIVEIDALLGGLKCIPLKDDLASWKKELRLSQKATWGDERKTQKSDCALKQRQSSATVVLDLDHVGARFSGV